VADNLMMASVGSMIAGSGRSSTRTSFGPYSIVPFMIDLLLRMYIYLKLPENRRLKTLIIR
jgi:hypothetical protein